MISRFHKRALLWVVVVSGLLLGWTAGTTTTQHLIGGAPQGLQVLKHGAVIDGLGAARPWPMPLAAREQPDGVLAVVLANRAEFIEDGRLGAAAGDTVPLADRGQVFFAGTNSHVPCSFR